MKLFAEFRAQQTPEAEGEERGAEPQLKKEGALAG